MIRHIVCAFAIALILMPFHVKAQEGADKEFTKCERSIAEYIGQYSYIVQWMAGIKKSFDELAIACHKFDPDMYSLEKVDNWLSLSDRQLSKGVEALEHLLNKPEDVTFKDSCREDYVQIRQQSLQLASEQLSELKQRQDTLKEKDMTGILDEIPVDNLDILCEQDLYQYVILNNKEGSAPFSQIMLREHFLYSYGKEHSRLIKMNNENESQVFLHDRLEDMNAFKEFEQALRDVGFSYSKTQPSPE